MQIDATEGCPPFKSKVTLSSRHEAVREGEPPREPRLRCRLTARRASVAACLSLLVGTLCQPVRTTCKSTAEVQYRSDRRIILLL